MYTKTVQSRKDEVLTNLLQEYTEGLKEEEVIVACVAKWDVLIKECVANSDDFKQKLHQTQLKNARNKGFLKSLLPKYPHKCKINVMININF